MRLAPGARIDRYELVHQVAQGGMGAVWAARLSGAHGFEKLFAIKTILPQHASDAKFRSMLLDEARIAAKIHHPNVAQTIELGETEGLLYLVMEWVEGESLHSLKKIPLGVALRVVADACAGLHAAHELPDLEVVHRDVSPHNILVGVNGIAKVIDFGIARARGRLSETTSPGTKGKVRYMAPEQALGWKVDRRADVWSLGAVLFELVVGTTPHDADHDAIVLQHLVSSRPIRAIPTTVPGPVARVLRRALSHAREARFATAAEMGAAIASAMDECNLITTHLDVARELAPRMERRPTVVLDDRTEVAVKPPIALSRPARRSRAPWPIVATALAALLVGAGAMATTRTDALQTLRVHVTMPWPRPTQAVTAPPTVVIETPAPSRRVASPSAPPPAPPPPSSAAPAPPPPPPQAAPPSCDPPYVVDSAGHRRYRRECL